MDLESGSLKLTKDELKVKTDLHKNPQMGQEVHKFSLIEAMFWVSNL